MGRTLHSDKSCAKICQHSLRNEKEWWQGSLRVKLKLLILIDESTTISKKSVLIIYITASLDGNDIIELSYYYRNNIITYLSESDDDQCTSCTQLSSLQKSDLVENLIFFITSSRCFL